MSYTPIITITGKIQDFLGNNAVGATVSVRLTNFGLDIPRVPGSCIISSPTIPVAQDGLGGFSFTPIGNDVITPANTFYLVTFTSDNANTASLTIPYQFTGTGTQDLSQIIPFNQGGIGGPQISNIVVKNPTALQTIASFGLSVPQIQDLTAPLLPHTAGGTDIGSASLPFANVYVGSSATNNIKVTGTASAARVFTLPDANSNPIQPVSGVTAHQWVAWIDSNGVQHLSQPDYSDLTGKPQLAVAFGSVPHEFLTSYTSSTGAFTAAQPSFSDISGTSGLAQGGTGVDLSASGGSGFILKQNASHIISAGALVAGDIPSLDASKITTGTLSASQLPNPSATTLGGIEAFIPVAHQWINEITTSGVPLATQPAASDLSNGTTGSGAVVLATAPAIGAATVTSINKMAVTAPATSSTLAVADGKTLTASNTLTLQGTDATTLTFQGTGTVVNRASTDTLTNKTIDTSGAGNHIQIAGVDLPASIGTSGQVLTNSSGTLAFTTVGGGGGGTPGGATNSIQYNTGSAFGGVGILSPAGTLLPNPTFINVFKNITSTGDIDLYTCPANRRAIACEFTLFNNSGSSSGMFMEVKLSGTYYATTASTTVTNTLNGSRSSPYVLEAGDTIAINVTAQPCNVFAGVLEFDATANIKTAKITSISSGDNTVYTCPNGKSALILNNQFLMCAGAAGTFSFGNLTGSTRTVKFNLVPFGGSPGSTNQVTSSSSVSSGSASNFTPTSLTIGAGDFVSVNSDASTAGQIAFVTVVEI